MVSRKRAGAAVRAAGALEKKGRLLSFLGKISDQELAQWDLEDTEEDKTIHDFILNRAQGGGGGGVAAATGYSLKATRMMEALRSMQALPRPGEVLNLGPDVSFLLHPKYNALFVRECYPRLFDALVRHSKPRLYIVTGTPGIGKSWFLYYVLARLLHSTLPPPFIVWEHMTARGQAWCYTHETREVVTGKLTSFDDVLSNPATWYIADGVPPQLSCLARTVLLTWPKRETYKEMRKAGAEMLYMPRWELGELLACRSLLYGTVDEALAKELYQHYGGVARFVLGIPEANPSKGLDELLEELHEAVAGCDAAQMRRSIGSIISGPEASHMLLHIVASGETFKMQHLVFASQWVAVELAKKAMRDEMQGLVRLLGSTSGALNRMLYEATVHAVLSKGGRFTAVPVEYDVETSTFQRGVEEELMFDRCALQESFEVLPEIATEQVYYRPSSATFPTVDACKRGKDTCDFFQMTVQDSRELDAVKLSSVLNKVQLPAGVTPRLHFVVPEDSYPNFQLKAGNSWPPAPSQAASRMKLYVMKGVHARLQVCARPGHVGGPTAGGGGKLRL